MNILLDYFFPITSITPTPAASTAYLKQVLAICKPKMGATEDTPTLCTSTSAIDAFSTTNTEMDQFFSAGMSRIYVMASDDLTGVGDNIEGNINDFFTIVITSDFNDSEIDALDIGDFKGVVAMASTDDAKNATRAAIENTCAFHSTSSNKAKNMCYAFGKFLSNASDWLNQQYITMPLADDVATLGDANALFDDKISFVMNDDEFGHRLSLFAQGGKAITEPYIKQNLKIDLQSAGLSYVSGNQPDYTKTQAALLEDELDKVVKSYIARQWIEAGTVSVTLEEDNFVADADFNISEPKALWRIFGQMQQTL